MSIINNGNKESELPSTTADRAEENAPDSGETSTNTRVDVTTAAETAADTSTNGDPAVATDGTADAANDTGEPPGGPLGTVGRAALGAAAGSEAARGAPLPTWGQVIIEPPTGLKPRQLKAWLRREVGSAIEEGNLPRIRALNEVLEELDARADHRAHRDGLLRKANRENAYDPNLIEAYEEWTIHDILGKYQKSIRFDLGHLGLVGGLAVLLSEAAADIGEPVSDRVLRAQTKSLAWRLKERIYGLGYEFTTDANQVLRKLADLLGEGPVPQEKMFKKQPLPGLQAWDAEFEKDWNEWLSSRTTREAV